MASSTGTTHSNEIIMSNLPGIFQGSKEEDLLLRNLLAPFEEILFGETGLHSTIASLADYLDARKAPNPFLSWLAAWMGTTLYHQLPGAQQREFVANAADYYCHRGTSDNLKRLLELFIGVAVQIEEPDFPVFQVGVPAAIGHDTYIEGGPPHAFLVRVTLPASTGAADEETGNRQGQITRLARAVIDLEKPAHTTYELEVSTGSATGDVAAAPPSPAS